jgi:hypothetical protein
LAISYPLALPTSIGIANITLSANNAVAVSSSPFTFRQQIVQHAGQRWTASVSIPPVRRDLAEPWNAFLLALNGPVGTFLLGDPNAREPQGAIKNDSSWFLAGGVWNEGLWQDSLLYSYNPSSDVFAYPLVNGNQGIGTNSLLVKNVAANISNVFFAGDYIQLGSGANATLHKVLQNASSNSSGNLTLEIWPAIRRSVLNNEVVTFRNTVGRFRLSGNQQSFNIDNASIYGISFDCVEAV